MKNEGNIVLFFKFISFDQVEELLEHIDQLEQSVRFQLLAIL